MTADHDWVVGRLARVQGVRHAIVCSVDGLLKARSESTGPEEADRLSARCSGLLSLARDQAGEFGTGEKALYQLMVGHEGGYLFVRSAAARSCLAVVTGPVINAALIAQEMQAMVLKLGEQTLATPARGGGMA
ncbi:MULTISPECIES: roadblock/LC7 domain-containing protein [Actinomadura]|uniref:Roadblock/LC7 domain-containing protein n=2 Tax=Actinomadura yumaensis TaxID=111807 RepID=A0ABW2CMK2_9ACTN|nr:roadblock/LC7 domain-containing protein [Actinomadura sp. J1-007]MWK38682.1 roadblock/LC7 domain-containing protein [Actinomadura sp. J1-007]